MATLEVITRLLSILVTIGGIKLLQWWILKKYKHWKNNKDAVAQANRDILNGLMVELKAIKYEVKPNGGTSIKDQITRIEAKQEWTNHAIENLKTEQRNMREIQDIAIWESDSDGRVNYASVNFCEIIGCTQKDLMDNSWAAFVDVDDRKRVMDEWFFSVKNASEYNCTYNYKRTDGMYQKVKAVCIHNKDTAGKVVNSLGRIQTIGEPFKK